MSEAVTISLGRAAARDTRLGFALGTLGVLIFALSIPMTRLASGSAGDPQLPAAFVAIGRAAFAGLLAAAYLLAVRARWPRGSEWLALAATALGVVFGWPLFLGFAVLHVDASHASVVTGVLPLATAAIGAVMLRQRPSAGFWLCAIGGCALVFVFAAWRGGAAPQWADALLLLAVLSASFGYVSGARLSSVGPRGADGAGPPRGRPRSWGGPATGRLPPEQVISWVLVLSLPVTLPFSIAFWPAQPVNTSAWGGFAYVSVFSMWLGFFAWYRGLALGGTLRVSQVQLLQPFLSLLLCVPVLGEPLDIATVAFALAVMATVFAGKRAAVA
jgi:drug/metabolite transporter (DMT)-like permease